MLLRLLGQPFKVLFPQSWNLLNEFLAKLGHDQEGTIFQRATYRLDLCEAFLRRVGVLLIALGAGGSMLVALLVWSLPKMSGGNKTIDDFTPLAVSPSIFLFSGALLLRPVFFELTAGVWIGVGIALLLRFFGINRPLDVSFPWFAAVALSGPVIAELSRLWRVPVFYYVVIWVVFVLPAQRAQRIGMIPADTFFSWWIGIYTIISFVGSVLASG